MRRGVIVLLLLLALRVSVCAADYTAQEAEILGADKLTTALDAQTIDALDGVTPTSGGNFGKQLWKLVTDALSGSSGILRGAMLTAGKVLAAALCCAFAANVQEDGPKEPALVAGAFAITALCTRDFQSMIGLARQTMDEIASFTSLLLPVMSSSLAASGGAVSAGALLAGSSLAMSVLTSLCSGLLIPLVYLYILLAAAESAVDGGGLSKIRELCGWAVGLGTKGVCRAFTAYLTLSRLLTAPADTAAVKAAQAAFSGMVPVVGSILSDASGSLLASAALIRSSAGLFGMLAVLAMAIGPFLKLGAGYLALRLAAAVCMDAICKPHAALIGNLASAMGYMLAIIASATWMSLVSASCFLKAVAA